MKMSHEIIFNGINKQSWFSVIVENQNMPRNISNKKVYVKVNGISSTDELAPFHMVLLACLRQSLKDNGYHDCYISTDNNDLQTFLMENINLGQYWRGASPTNHTESLTETIFNLWRVSDSEKESYGDGVLSYLKRNFFKGKDLSAVKNSLLEIFYNIFDHAQANENAFSYMKYDKESTRLYVAVCDFGKGIAENIRNYFNDIKDDQEAILFATEYEVTTQSRTHNRGMGIGNIIGILGKNDSLHIVSNRAMLIVENNKKTTYPIDFNFSGTIIYYDVSLSNFEDEEILDNFGLDF